MQKNKHTVLFHLHDIQSSGTDSAVDVYLGLVIGEEIDYVGVAGNLQNEENNLYFYSVDGHKTVTHKSIHLKIDVKKYNKLLKTT